MRNAARTLLAAAVLAAGALLAPSAWADVSNLGGTWSVDSSSVATQTGAQISTPGFGVSAWLPESTDDAGGGLTEIGALAQNGDQAPGVPNANCALANVLYSSNMLACWGQGSVGGAPSNATFAVPWWFRTDFTTPAGFGANHGAQLIVNGVVGQADVWVNGVEVATQATVTGDYAQYTFDITGLLAPAGATNSIALEVYPNNPKTMFTLDTVDWNQPPPDNNTGIQFPVQVDYYGTLQLSNAHVVENNAPDLSNSQLTLKGDVTNNTSSAQTGTVSATVSNPQGQTIATVQQSVTVPANSTQTVVFDPTVYSSLVVNNPQLWWPYQMGGQPLYSMGMSVTDPNSVTDNAASQTFGIRTVTSYLTPPSNMAPNGVRWFAVNGKQFVWRSGGWSENLFLRYSSSDIANQIAVIKSMGLQGVRTEGKEMPADFYEQFDKAGLIVDGGFQCCDKWQFSATNATQNDYNVMYLSSLQIGKRLRDHPSVFNFSWSDNNPTAEQESVSLQGFSQADFQDPIVSSAEYKSSPILGPSGEKEGPYNWAPPSYWYDTTHESTDTSFTDVGGSWAFDSEASPGHTTPTLDSLNRFMSSDDLLNLWQNPNAQLYHTDPDGSNNNFGGLQNEDKAVTARYGPWTANPTTGTASTTNGSTTLSNVLQTSGANSTFLIGEPISGPGIPAATTITAVTLSAATGAITAGSTTITGVNVTAGTFAVGEVITSTGSPNPFPGGTTIASITGATWTISKPALVNGTSIAGGPSSMTISQAATATATGVTVSGPQAVALSGGEGFGLGQWDEESQVLNYESQRAIFEAFIDHSTNWPTPSTGLDYWMLNKGWPTLLWNLYNNDYDEAGSYFGAKKAQEAVHVLYGYDNGTVTVDNLSGTTQTGLSVESKVYSVGGTVLDDQTASNIALPAQGVQNSVLTPVVPAATAPPTPAQTYFIELTMRQNGAVIDRNVYWLSTQPDVSIPSGSASPATSQYANMTALQSLPATSVSVTTASSGGANHETDVTLTNTGSTVAFFLRVDVRRDCSVTPCPASGALSLPNNELLPISYSDNDVTLWPGESQTIQATYAQSLLQGDNPMVSVSGWNVPSATYGAHASVSSDPGSASSAGQSSGGATPSADNPAPAAATTPAGLDAGTPVTKPNPTPGVDNSPAAMAALHRRIAVLHASAALTRSGAVVHIGCRGASGTACTGTLTLTALAHSSSLVLARHAYSLRAGRSRVLHFALAHSARARLGATKTKLVVRVVSGR